MNHVRITSTVHLTTVVGHFPLSDRRSYGQPADYDDGNRGKSSNMGRSIISYQKVLHSLLKNVNDQAHDAVLCSQSTNGQLLRTSILTGRLCFCAL